MDSSWVAGGVYVSPFALDELIRCYEQDSGSEALVFNGDFH